MRHMRGHDLHLLPGLDIALPAVMRLDGPQADGAPRLRLVAGLAAGHVDTIVAPLAAYWLGQHLHRDFVEHGRGAEGNLAAEAFYDKLGEEFAADAAFVAIIVEPCAGAAAPAGPSAVEAACCKVLSEAKCIRWKCRGAVRVHIAPATMLAQVSFGDLPGGIDLIGADHPASAPAKRAAAARGLCAWYGFGIATRNPADTVGALRRGLGEARHVPLKAHAA